MPGSRATLLALVLIACPGSALARDVTTLAFRWPDHLQCEVERKTRSAFGSGEGRTVETSDRHRLEASRERGGWVIRRTYLGGIDRRGAPESARRTQDMADRLPAFRVRADGSFAGLMLDPATRRHLLVREREWREQGKGSGMDLTKGVPSPGSQAQLEAQARGEWMDLVETWRGAALELGVPLSREGQRELAVPPGGPTRVKARERGRLVARVASTAGPPPVSSWSR